MSKVVLNRYTRDISAIAGIIDILQCSYMHARDIVKHNTPVYIGTKRECEKLAFALKKWEVDTRII